ncbi:PTS system fructose-specific transporter subunit IIABC [Lacticaseibacillus paracasei subsp. paracasei CNCM I-4270]|uniref:PTS system fructose-specific transporter subunit IIABC n=1 Tax=Lacticaseibacillus paracasei subsp. paracasei CNCM I-4270 TaxID=1256202 RepID=A0A8E0MD49_LACPA|nr:PTS system fructose-specific transporter subunit IIABC [Lacticaseibacillus paracasei subsp. paracasei CNCM I-4270]
MDMTLITDPSLIFLHQDWQSKEEVLDHLINAFASEGVVNDKAVYKQAVLDREKISETGFENGFAIPHGKSVAVTKPAVAIVTLKKPLASAAWASTDPTNQVELIFLLAIPESQKGDAYLKILSDLAVRLMDEKLVDQLKHANTADQVIQLLGKKNQEATTTIKETKKRPKQILAITACATGIAHTYMAAEALQKAAAAKGVQIHVEKQGANGIEDGITPEMLKDADGVIFATDIAAKGKERFKGIPFVQTKVAEPLKHGEAMIDQVLNHPDGVVQGEAAASEVATTGKKQSWQSTLMQSVMTGISYMIPILVAAGVMIGLSQIGASFFGLNKVIGDPKMATNANQMIVLLYYMGQCGNMAMKFMYPIFTAFMAYSIADRPAIAPGFVGGAFAAGFQFILLGNAKGIPSGFFGALFLGALVGFLVKYMNEHIHLNKNFSAMKPMLILPGVSILVVFLANFFIVDPVFGGLNAWLQQMVLTYKDSSEVLLSSIIACLTAFDLGGPVNKAAGAVASGMAADKVFPLTPRVLSIVIPPIGIGLATLIDKYVVGRHVFDEDLRVSGKTSLLLGFLAIGEGAIPFALANPLITIPINMLGATLGSVTAVLLGAVQWYPLPAVWGWPLVQNFPAYAVGILVGVLFIALTNIFIRFHIIRKKEKTTTAVK